MSVRVTDEVPSVIICQMELPEVEICTSVPLQRMRLHSFGQEAITVVSLPEVLSS